MIENKFSLFMGSIYSVHFKFTLFIFDRLLSGLDMPEQHVNPIALRKAKTVYMYNYGLPECSMVKYGSLSNQPGRVAQLVRHLTRKSGVLGSIPGRATYFRFSFRFFKKGSCQLLAKVCARSTG